MTMGTLKPGATYTYENINGIVYATDSEETERKEIGWNYDSRTRDGRPLIDHIRDDKLWGEIRRAAETNLVLREALERVKMLYHLSKDHGKT